MSDRRARGLAPIGLCLGHLLALGPLQPHQQGIEQLTLVRALGQPAGFQLLGLGQQLGQLGRRGALAHPRQGALEALDDLHHQPLFLAPVTGPGQGPIGADPGLQQAERGPHGGRLGRVLQAAQQLGQHPHVLGAALQQAEAGLGHRVEIHLAVGQGAQLDQLGLHIVPARLIGQHGASYLFIRQAAEQAGTPGVSIAHGAPYQRHC
ncbi:hypothetical protein D3C76_1131170 [compost metagenome]